MIRGGDRARELILWLVLSVTIFSLLWLASEKVGAEECGKITDYRSVRVSDVNNYLKQGYILYGASACTSIACWQSVIMFKECEGVNDER